jgi:hypothetical protein
LSGVGLKVGSELMLVGRLSMAVSDPRQPIPLQTDSAASAKREHFLAKAPRMAARFSAHRWPSSAN